MSTCRYCGQNAGFLRKQHGQCRDLHATGFTEMVQLAAQAPSAHTFNESALRALARGIPSLGSLLHRPAAGTKQRPGRIALDMGPREGQNKPPETPDQLPVLAVRRDRGVPWDPSGRRPAGGLQI